jgi:hypothetical protein
MKKKSGNRMSSAQANQWKVLDFYLSKFWVVFFPVFIQKLFSNLARKHRKGSLSLLFKSIHILDEAQ